MSELIKSVLGFFTGRTPEYLHMMQSIKEFEQILADQSERHDQQVKSRDADIEQLRGLLRESMAREVEMQKQLREQNKHIMKLEQNVSQLERKVKKLENERTNNNKITGATGI